MPADRAGHAAVAVPEEVRVVDQFRSGLGGLRGAASVDSVGWSATG
ncbi:hypothetical protein [Streptomyces sp. RerS4]|nr:hypothetical protein [Streptomyces sp. RerS4]UQW99159.1 hypothetical protein M4D82_00340 [Streptomyces sp. RerS4]